MMITRNVSKTTTLTCSFVRPISTTKGSSCNCCGLPFSWCYKKSNGALFDKMRNSLDGKAVSYPKRPISFLLETPRKQPYSKKYPEESKETNQFGGPKNYEAIDQIIENNRKWAETKIAADPDFLAMLQRPQKPKFLYFGCSDSRVPANEILGLGPGELFVHRNVGNLIPGNDLSALSVIEFAVGKLEVSDIIVTGHYDCGAIRAASSRQDLGMLENWFRLIRDVYRLHRDYLDSIDDDDERLNKLVELNVIEQCLNLYKTGVVQRRRIQTHNLGIPMVPRIHGLVFSPLDGLLKRLKVNYARRVGSLEHIYGLYDP